MFNVRAVDTKYHDKVIFTTHAAERIFERAGILRNQVIRAIIKACEEIDKLVARNPKWTGTLKEESGVMDVVISNDSADDSYVVITVINGMDM
jgi:hypothetical protein